MKFNYIFLIVTLLFGVIFYDTIQLNLGFSYIDELLALALALRLCFNGKFTKEFIVFLFVAVFYLAHSLLDPHNVRDAIWMDFLIQIKPYVAFYAVYTVSFKLTARQEQGICRFCKLFAVLLLPIGLLNVGGGELMEQVGGYARYATMMTILGMTHLIYSKQTKKNLTIATLIIAVGLLSLRSKAFGFFAAYAGIMFLWNLKEQQKILTTRNILLSTIVLGAIAFVAWGKIDFYFVQGGTEAENMFARPLLYAECWEILHDFPFFGTGFGSYATNASAVYYSPLYLKYGLAYSSEIGEGLFISDTYFPVFAQFGFVGIALFVWFWARRVKTAYWHFRQGCDVLYFKMVILIVVFFFIESVADSTFTHNRGMVMMMLLAIILRNKYDKVTQIANQGQKFLSPFPYK